MKHFINSYSAYLPVTIKEANWMFWKVNGHLIPENWNKMEIINMYDTYFAETWGNEDISSISEDNFAIAWETKNGNKQQNTISIQ